MSGHSNARIAQILDNEQLSATETSDPDSAGVAVRSKPLWQDETVLNLEPDTGLLVTHVNQTQDLLRIQGQNASASDSQTSEEWLGNHSLDSMKLSITHLLSQGRVVMAKGDCMRKEMEFSADTVNAFESRLYEILELYHRRIRWLMEGSRKMFGLVKGTRVGLAIDASDANFEAGRSDGFQRSLLYLLDEQLCYKKQLYLMSIGTDDSPLWRTLRDVNIRTLHEARQWVQQLRPSGGCNVLQAMKKMLAVKELNSLVIILGSCPDQTSDVLFDYIAQCMIGRNLPVHTVAYDCSNPMTHTALKKLAKASGGRFHCYSSDSQDLTYSSCDVHLLWRESQRAVDLLNKIKGMRQGMMGDALISIMQEISTEVAKLPPTRFLPRPPNHDRPLCIEMPNFLPKTSGEWIKSNGLKAKRLSLYQVLAPNAFSLVEEFVPILRKTVCSTLHEKAMMQFEWHDGTVKNIHVDPPLLYNYQKQLGQTVKMYERRVEWLTSGSRQIWGTVCEQRVIILVDVSETNSMYIIHIQHSLRLLLEQQMTNKECFNIIAYGSEMKPWNTEMVPPTPENLQDAWKWVQSLQCEGSRNLMGALKHALEVDLLDEQIGCQGIYLFTSGVPDQDGALVSSYVAERCGGCDLRLHVCLFSLDKFDLQGSIPARFATASDTANLLRDLALSGMGRFHWFKETGIIESDDINIIMAEMEKAVNYSQKCAMLVKSLKQRSDNKQPDDDPESEESQRAQIKREKRNPLKLSAPKPTALTLARMQAREDSLEDSPPSRALTWRPSSVKASIPPAQPMKSWSPSENEVKQKKKIEVSQSVFYTEEGNSVGLVFKKYPKAKSVRKSIPFAALPKEEAISSTKQWLKKFSIKRLKLDLHRLLSGPDCTHQKKLVPAMQKKVSAKYCTIFPSVEVNGVVKHLQFQPPELEEYIDQTERVLRRYIQRMQWLLSGSRRLFGTVLEKSVCILLDTSGSMDPYLSEVKKEMTSLIWEQLHKNGVSFNLLSFSDSVQVWKDRLMDATEEACHEAVQWVSMVKAHGSTCTLEALQAAFQFEDAQGFYLLTDGKPDTSCNFVLKETEKLMQGKQIAVHAISFNCSDSTANEFLKKLASQTGGRYHRCHGELDGHLVAHRMLTEGFTDEDDPVLPAFEGDDLRRLALEIGKARRFLTQARTFRALLLDKQMKSNKLDAFSTSPVYSEKSKSNLPVSKSTIS
ncbi:von Willebrand factor A domain-containing protein 3A isoform X1 [Acipenser ruthenus]|uniref:von Willebrand factor A domain-containing protein 3A isoform X1 n=1 Tax=Acipenser ruthenus TaxID=7906 RepID=UPI0027423992|nr:von Willebrand factor A domain-containing protein 3A isoform X1 [Acipenser ruthenus]